MSDNNSQNLPWLGRQLTVVESTDSSLLGRSGLVVDETMRTVAIDEVGSENRITLAKAAIKFHSARHQLDNLLYSMSLLSSMDAACAKFPSSISDWIY